MSDSIVVVSGGVVGDPLAARLRAALADTDADRSLVGADAVLALDAAGLVRARAAAVPVRVAVTRGLAARFDGGLEDATHVSIPHAAARSRAGQKPVLVVGLASAEQPAVPGPSAEGRAAARQSAGLDAGARVVVADAAELREVGLRSVLLQLALAEPAPAILFDVRDDVALADALRAELPGYALDAFVFAGLEREALLPLADLALGRASGAHLERALVAGLPVLPLPAEDAGDELALAVLAACGGAPAPRSLAVLSVALDAELGRAPRALAELDVSGVAERLVRATRDAVTAVREGRGPRAVGLPIGLERVGSREQTATPAGASPPEVAPPGGPERDASDLDARIDAELAALKKRL